MVVRRRLMRACAVSCTAIGNMKRITIRETAARKANMLIIK